VKTSFRRILIVLVLAALCVALVLRSTTPPPPQTASAAPSPSAGATATSTTPASVAAADSAAAPSSHSPTDRVGAVLPPIADGTTSHVGASAAAVLVLPAASAPRHLTTDELATRFAGAITPADLLRDTDLSDPAVRAFVVARMSEMQEQQHESALAKAKRLGIPVRIDGPGRKVSLLYDFRGDVPLYRTTLNVNAAISTGANILRDQNAPYGLDGTGMKIAIWDEAKVKNTHQEFPNNRVIIKDNATTFSDHSTHVAGTIGATGTVPSAKGMAPKVSIDSYDWNSDYAEMTAVGAVTANDTTGIPISNHSYGYDAVTADMGRYETEASTTDALAADLPFYNIFWAAGNEQDTLTAQGGYQSITFNGLAKNIITVAAADDAVSGGARNPAVGTLAYFSSEGPCDDGRIKPDLTANGVGLYSSVAFVPPAGTSASTTAYDTYSGTSMATPNAVGSAILLEQLYAREFSGQRLRASMLKALLIETADDVGRPGPDYQYGWGYLNVKTAADLLLAHKASLASPKLIEGTITNASKTQTHTFTWDGASPIRATLCWTDPAGAAQTAADSRTPNLKNDLDLKITAPDGTTNHLPFVMPFVGTWTTASMSSNATTGVNHVDNVEQVYVAMPSQPGNYTITVALPGTLTGSSQIYSLVVAGGTGVEANPAPVVTLDSPAAGTVLLPNVPVTLTATATDKVVGGGPGVVVNVQFFNGATSLGSVSTPPYTLAWTPPAAGTYVLTAAAIDTEGATGASAATTLTVLSGDGTPTLAAFTPGSGTSGDTITLTGSNFAAVSAVKFNGVDALFTINSTASISATVPAAAATGTISVTTPYGTAASPSAFTILQNPVLISQIYGAGGNTGAIYNSDYVELYNRGDTPVSLSGWSVQYASASGTTWSTAALTGSIPAGKNYLVKLAGGSTGVALPAPDATGSINMSGSQGKVALRTTTAVFTGSTPVGQSGLQDFVGFGNANAYEGAAAPSPSSTTAIFRTGGGATDTGINSADFIAAAPNPRNSTAGAPAAPVISSATAASGAVSQAFSYQIAASNTPTSFAAIGLPAGLTVNTSTGLISGAPTAAGVSSVTISATNATGTGSATLTVTIAASGGGGTGYTVDFEDGTKSAYASGSVTLNGISWNMTDALIGAGDSNDFKNGAKSARLRGYSTSVITMLTDKPGGVGTISFQHRRYGTDTQVEWTVEYSLNAGSTWAEAGKFTAGASVAAFTATINQQGAVRIRIRTAATGTGTNRRANVDDIVVADATTASTPVITATGALAAVDTTYGTASPTPASFTVAGANMTAGILVTAPSGFEVSQTAGGASGYATTQTVGAAGAITSTTVYVRLATDTPVDSYAGNIVCTSVGAAPVNVPVATSAVSPKVLVITAQNRAKFFGATLSLGDSAFDASGLVLGQTIGSVTLTASGGTAAADAPGTYSITPSAATGGTFVAANYDISYQPGALTVTAPTFAEWAVGLSDPAATADPDADGVPNLIEYFMGLNPTVQDAVASSVQYTGSELQLDYRRSKMLNGVSGAVEWTASLSGAVNWSTGGVTDTFLSDQGTYELRRASVSFTNPETAKFLRLHVTQP
jgi:Subtilase family/Lamin Tail Domain/Bacterial Ig domain/Putative Ig domain/IPT/TIG domain